MKIMSNKKFEQLILDMELEHMKHINQLCSTYEDTINSICESKLTLRLENKNLKNQLKNLECNKIRYLKMLENKSFKKKRLNKKYKNKLVREIQLLFWER